MLPIYMALIDDEEDKSDFENEVHPSDDDARSHAFGC